MDTRVTGIGGVFYKSKYPTVTKAWYKKHLGLPIDDYGATFWWQDKDGNDCATQWSLFDELTNYMEPSEKPFMINFRVKNLVELLKILEKEGVTIVGQMQEFEYGKFGWIMDPEGNKIELWEPVDQAFL